MGASMAYRVTHVRTRNGLAYRFRVRRILLAAFNERFDVGWWDQASIMPEF
jgi:hypothetical protein